MSSVSLFDLVSATAIVVGLVIGIVELQLARRRRQRESAMRVFSIFVTSDFVRSLHRVVDLPDGLGKEELIAHLGDDLDDFYYFLSTLEALGVLVYRREISIELVEDNWSGPILIGWRKLEQYVQEQREAMGRENWAEWVQWLAERIGEGERDKPAVPAHIEHKDWKA